jgi:hypothetical protein
MKNEEWEFHSSFFIVLPSSPIARSGYQREQHREEGDPGEQNQDISRRGGVSHRGPPGGVGSAS